MMRSVIILLTVSFLAVALMATTGKGYVTVNMDQCINKFKTDSKIFANSTFALRKAIENIQAGDSGAVVKARLLLGDSRMRYKPLEFFITYFFPTEAVTYNMPPKAEVEEQPTLELTEPVGLQVIESLLFEKDVYAHKNELLQQMEVITSSAEDLNSLLFNFRGNAKQILESLRLELVRIMVLGISGYDAPLLKSGIGESYTALFSVNEILHPLLEKSNGSADSVSFYMQRALAFLQDNKDFDRFDRLHFLMNCALPLQFHLGKWIRQTGMELNSTSALNYSAANLFSADQLIKKAFSSSPVAENKAVADLGKALFFEKSLSGNSINSCASCHNPAMYYTDGLARSTAFNGHSSLQRNAPSIMYSVFQYGQGWDGRLPGLEAQVIKVLSSPEEMNAKEEVIVRCLRQKKEYRELFKEAFSIQHADSCVNMKNIALAIAAFVRTCTPFTAAFDRYIGGDPLALTPAQKNGFNLFMGKAQCGTCHFAPLFNGLTPPLYDLSESEVIGVPATSELDHPAYDTDRGRYNLYPIHVYDKAFKTPGLRNVAKTAPYMHNGSFSTLKQVMDFYNKGGSAGIGLALPNQTLPATPLNLSDREVADVISFMEALTDSLPTGNKHITYNDKRK